MQRLVRRGYCYDTVLPASVSDNVHEYVAKMPRRGSFLRDSNVRRSDWSESVTAYFRERVLAETGLGKPSVATCLAESMIPTAPRSGTRKVTPRAINASRRVANERYDTVRVPCGHGSCTNAQP